MSNSVFAIDYDAYGLRLDRKALAYTLTLGSAGVWADSLSIGWIALEERASGVCTRHDFAQCRLVSLSEKMGAQGKRILFGLDAPGGVPIDLYFTCGPREIQLVVEASRDSRSHRVVRLGLLPDLLAGDAVGPEAPFCGAVRGGSALALHFDSEYARREGATLLWGGDPERRRLDLRIVPLPGGDTVAVARAYREHAVREGLHVPLRKQARQDPALQAFLESDDRPEAWGPCARVAAGGFPFHAVLWRDATLAFADDFPTALLNLTRMVGASDGQHAVLAALHRRSIGGFLTGWEEAEGVVRAEYSHGFRLVLDRGGAGFEDDRLELPPGGFWVAGPGFCAHDALRVDQARYPERGIRGQEFEDSGANPPP